MEATGVTFGILGFVFAIIAMKRIDKLEKRLKELSVLEENFKSK